MKSSRGANVRQKYPTNQFVSTIAARTKTAKPPLRRTGHSSSTNRVAVVEQREFDWFQGACTHPSTGISRSRIVLPAWERKPRVKIRSQTRSIVMRIGPRVGYIIYFFRFIYFFAHVRLSYSPPSEWDCDPGAAEADTGSSGSRCLGFLRKLHRRYFPTSRWSYFICNYRTAIDQYIPRCSNSSRYAVSTAFHCWLDKHCKLAVGCLTSRKSIYIFPSKARMIVVVSSIPVAGWYRFSTLSFLFFCRITFYATGPWPWVTARSLLSSPFEYVKVRGIRWIL